MNFDKLIKILDNVSNDAIWPLINQNCKDFFITNNRQSYPRHK